MDEKQEKLSTLIKIIKEGAARAKLEDPEYNIGIAINKMNLVMKVRLGGIAESFLDDIDRGKNIYGDDIGCLFIYVLCITEAHGVCIDKVISPLRKGICEIHSDANISVLDVFNEMAKSITDYDSIHAHDDFEITAWASSAIVSLMAFASKLGFTLIDCVELPDDEE